MEGTNSMSPADLMAIMNNGGSSAAWNNNPFLWLIFLAMVGNGNFGFGGGNNANLNGMVTRAELADGLNNQTVLNDLNTINSNIGNGTSSIKQDLCSGFNSVNAAANSNANMITQSINNSNAANQMGFCSVNNNIEGLKYSMAQQCCDLKTAMHSEGEATRLLIQNNTIQDLRDKLADKDSDLHTAQMSLSNSEQTQYILNALGKYYPTTNCTAYNW